MLPPEVAAAVGAADDVVPVGFEAGTGLAVNLAGDFLEWSGRLLDEVPSVGVCCVWPRPFSIGWTSDCSATARDSTTTITPCCGSRRRRRLAAMPSSILKRSKQQNVPSIWSCGDGAFTVSFTNETVEPLCPKCGT